MHIVLVDPSGVVRKTLSGMLVSAGHSVIPFSDSAAALAHIVADRSVTCVLTSLEVQPLDGLELCWSLRALADDRRPLTILVMSSAREKRPLDEVLDAGADDFLMKPPEAQELRGRPNRLRPGRQVWKAACTNTFWILSSHRGAFMRQARAAVESAAVSRPLAVMQLDIDHFKRINDRHGHDVGDLVIRHVAQILRETGAISGRLGGEEYALLLPDHSLGAAAVVAHRIRSQCAGSALLDRSSPLRFTVSIGLSEWSEGDSVGTLLKRADVSLYAAKEGGRDRVAMTSSTLKIEFVS